MRNARMLLGLGIWVALLPYLGFPYIWKNILFTLTGLILVYFAFSLYKISKNSKEIANQKFESFAENRDFITREETEDLSN